MKRERDYHRALIGLTFALLLAVGAGSASATAFPTLELAPDGKVQHSDSSSPSRALQLNAETPGVSSLSAADVLYQALATGHLRFSGNENAPSVTGIILAVARTVQLSPAPSIDVLTGRSVNLSSSASMMGLVPEKDWLPN